jgi:hypothetical protein
LSRTCVGDAFVWPCSAGGDAGGEVEGDEAFALAGVADEEGDFADGDAPVPEPLDALSLHLAGEEEIGFFDGAVGEGFVEGVGFGVVAEHGGTSLGLV